WPRDWSSDVCSSDLLLGGEFADLLGLCALLLRQSTGLAGERVHLVRGKLLLRAREQIRRLTKLIGGLLPCSACVLLRPVRAFHRVGRPSQTFECLLCSRISGFPCLRAAP